jgi:hypothetical protein
VTAGVSNSKGGTLTGGKLSEERGGGAFESVLARLVATAGIVGIGTALGALLVALNVAGWITGLVVAGVTVALTAMLCPRRV